MNNEWIKEYVGALFGYCMNRLNNIEDAKDLTQEIIFEALKGSKKADIANRSVWVWKIAHNRYARFLSKRNSMMVSFEENEFINSDWDDRYTIEDDEELVNIFRAVHSIAKIHREILIDYYVSDLSYSDIARKHNIPVNTVKTRLYYGKAKLKERWQIKMDSRHIYERINWFICGNGDNNPYLYLDRQTVRAIAAACYEVPLNIEEISLKTGIPCMYIEDEIPRLLYGEILVNKNDKYLTNFIIHTRELTEKIEKILLSQSKILAQKTSDILTRYDRDIRAIGFYGNHFECCRLWWMLIPILLRHACEEARAANSDTARCDFPLRKDGGSGWIFVNVSEDERHKYFSGCNGYYKKDSTFTYYWSSKYFSHELSDYMCSLEDISDLKLENFSEYKIAQGIQYNLIQKTNDRYLWNIPVFTHSQMKQLHKLNHEMASSLVADLVPLVNRIYQLMKHDTPKHLHDQIKGCFGAELNSLIAMVCDELEDSGQLQKPENPYFTSQIFMIKKSNDE